MSIIFDLPKYFTKFQGNSRTCLRLDKYSLFISEISRYPKGRTHKDINKKERKAGKDQVLSIADKTISHEATNRMSQFQLNKY
jgi:hypothetical protein